MMRCVRTLHVVVMLFMIFGWISSNPKVLMAHIITVLVVMLQWRLNSGRCILTDIEHFLKRRQVNRIAITDSSEETSFTRRMCEAIGIGLSDKALSFLIYAVLYTSVSISVVKLY